MRDETFNEVFRTFTQDALHEGNLDEAMARIPTVVWITYKKGQVGGPTMSGSRTPDVKPEPVGIFMSEAEAKSAAKKGDLGVEKVNLSLPRV